MLTKLIEAIEPQYMLIVTLYTLNLYSVVCELYLNKTGGRAGRSMSKCDVCMFPKVR